MILRLGGYAEGLFDFHDFGFPKSVLEEHINSVYGLVSSLKDSANKSSLVLKPAGLPEGALWEDSGDSWNYLQTLRLAAGASMISQIYKDHISNENLRRSTTAKVLHKCQIGILDDVIDKGNYTYLEAKDLHHLVLSSMIDPDFDSGVFMKRLMNTLKQEDIQFFEIMTRITENFNVLYNSSPHGSVYFYTMELLDERIALGEALTMFQKEPHLDLRTMERISESFYAPSDDLTWYERLGAHISPASRYNFIDMAFSDVSYDLDSMKSFVEGWYYFDAAIILMDHVVNIYHDLRSGIANLSLIAMREKELSGLSSLHGYNPALTMDDYDAHLRRIAEFTSKGLELVSRDFSDPSFHYPFLTIMMPVVVMADWIGTRDDMIHALLRMMAPSIRAVVSTYPSATQPLEAKVRAMIGKS